MKTFVRNCIAAFALITAAAQAEIPVYHHQHFDLPSAVVLTANGPVYYGDVRFTTNDDGSFTLAEAKRRNLARVDTATVSVAQKQATVNVKGEQTIACVGLEEPGSVRDGNTFYVVIAETPIDPLALCLPFVAVTKFNVDVPLDLNGLTPGEYRVLVNGRETSFTLNQ